MADLEELLLACDLPLDGYHRDELCALKETVQHGWRDCRILVLEIRLKKHVQHTFQCLLHNLHYPINLLDLRRVRGGGKNEGRGEERSQVERREENRKKVREGRL